MRKAFKINEQPMAIQIKFYLTEWARPFLLKKDYVQMRNKLRRNPDMPLEEVKAMIEDGRRAYFGWTSTPK